ncbi:MAG: precorrin-2 dehydrogenase/sirohydrochlorin ferrochelatase family protein, partial [Pseudomonadales bacterium]
MRYLPLHFDIKGRKALVIGGGEVAERRIDLLLSAGAAITCVAPDIADSIEEKLGKPPHQLIQADYIKDTGDASETDQWLADAALVVAATDDAKVNSAVSQAAQVKGIPVNVVDSPELCTVTFPALVERSPLILSIGTEGVSPVLARRVREKLEALIPQGYARLAQYLSERRADIKKAFADVTARRRATEAFLDSPGAELAMQGQTEKADGYLFANQLPANQKQAMGEVY